jgi:hypothetical protein
MHCSRLGKSDVVLHLKVARTNRRCEACGVMYFSTPFSLEPEREHMLA